MSSNLVLNQLLISLTLLLSFIRTQNDFNSNESRERPQSTVAMIPGLLSGELLAGKFDYRREYSPQLRQIYVKYLGNNPFLTNCSQQTGKASDITTADMESAITYAKELTTAYETVMNALIAKLPLLKNFSKLLYRMEIQSKFNEYVSQYLSQIKCLNKEQSALKLQTLSTTDAVTNNGQLCDASRDVSVDDVNCDPLFRFSRIDGRCNNLVNTNWAANFTCFRSLLAPDYGDGVSRVRVARDGTALPLARVVTNALIGRRQQDLQDIGGHTGMHMMWGQYIAHDTFKFVPLFGPPLGCCPPTDGSQQPNEECANNSPVPSDQLTQAYNQTCMSQPRGVTCNACRLGARAQVNAATHVLDLSHLYGGNNNNSETLRVFSGGLLKTVLSLDNRTNILTQFLNTSESIDLFPCHPPSTRPWLTCFESGDGMRGNQQPMIQALHVLMTRRHNQHARALARVNGHKWDDERLFQESRRLLIAEYQTINYKEYVPVTLGANTRRYFALDVLRDSEFTRYEPEVNPKSMHEVGVGAFRFSHSQIASLFQVIHKIFYKSYGFLLRDKYFEPSDVWDGNTNAIIRGLIDDPEPAFDRFSVADVLDFLNFNDDMPLVIDLHSFDVIRGREFAVPGFASLVHYCSGLEINGWNDLNVLIPNQLITKLKTVYKDYRDLDLIVGGLYERWTQTNGSIMGPIFDCLNGMQFFHWKYGDRFYFEHRDQAGSFTREQLIDIREKSTLGRIICATTDLEWTQENVLLKRSLSNREVRCHRYREMDYNLWRE